MTDASRTLRRAVSSSVRKLKTMTAISVAAAMVTTSVRPALPKTSRENHRRVARTPATAASPKTPHASAVRRKKVWSWPRWR